MATKWSERMGHRFLLNIKMEIPIQEIMRIAKDSVQFNEQQFEIEDDGVRRTVSLSQLSEIAAGAEECKLGDLISDSNNAGKLKIRSGYIHGGGVSLFLTFDNITPVIGDTLYIKANWTATVTDEVLLSGGVLNSAIIEQSGTAETTDTFDKDNPTGDHYRALGTWVDDGNGNPIWEKDGCGSYELKFCSNGVNGTFLGVRGDE